MLWFYVTKLHNLVVSEKHTAYVIEVATEEVLFFRHVCTFRKDRDNMNIAALFEATRFSPVVSPSLKIEAIFFSKHLQISTTLYAATTYTTVIILIAFLEAQISHEDRCSSKTLKKSVEADHFYKIFLSIYHSAGRHDPKDHNKIV
jgi:hypothetical protein